MWYDGLWRWWQIGGNMIVVSYGADVAKSAYDALAASDVARYLKAGDAVAIKPNLVVPCPALTGATTHPEAVEGIILFLRDFGVSKMKIIESSWVGGSTKRAFEECGYAALSKKYGVPLVDLKDDSSTALRHGGLEIAVCDEALGADFLLNAPVLKAHCQTRMTCCMKNLKGCIPDREKRKFHALGIHRPVAALNALLATGYCVVDGICGDLSFEEGGSPVESDRVIAGRDPLTVDSFCAELIGYRPDDIGYIAQGRAMGLGEPRAPGEADTRVVEIGAHDKPLHGPRCDHAAERYAGMIDEDQACSACYSSLVHALHRLGGKARVGGGKIHVGQGFRGKGGEGAGVGACARGFSRCVAGCPPKATDIIREFG